MENYDFLIKEYTPFIYSIASKFTNIDKEDLFQAGAQGLIKAFKRYDENSNTKFSSYAYEDVYGEMYKLIYQNNDLKITRDTLRLYKKIMQVYQYLTQVNQKIPSVYEIAEFIQKDVFLIEATMKSCQKSISLDSTTNIDDRSYFEKLASNQALSLDDKIFLKDTIDSLPEPEKSIINYRYYQDLTQKEIAEILGLSQVKVSRYEKKGIEKMRVYARSCA